QFGQFLGRKIKVSNQSVTQNLSAIIQLVSLGIIMETIPPKQTEADEAEGSAELSKTVQIPLSTENDLYEYETQHFGFTPTSLVNGMFNCVCDLYREALKAFAKACFEKNPTLMSEDELATARRAVGEKIDTDICTVFDALEHYLLSQVFSVPDSVVLPEDRCQLLRSSNEELSALEQKKGQLKRKIIALKFANAKLDRHRTQMASLQESLDEAINRLSSGSAKIGQLNAEGIGDWVSFYSELLMKATESQ
ncbi:hypothetical protein EGW08_020631, partial [Elysia chlorotica]